jgi:hypothetical protein
MNIADAVQTINRMVYRPGWSFEAEDFTNRFEGHVKIKVSYHAIQTNRENAPEYKAEIDTYASFAFRVDDVDKIELYGRVLDALMTIDQHEARETLRDPDTLDAPFHPHRIEGTLNWALRQRSKIDEVDTLSDIQFGLA